MATREDTKPTLSEALNAGSGMFAANLGFVAPQREHTLQTQLRLFGEAEKFAAAWFQRRQVATQSLIDAGRRIASAGQDDPSKAMSEMTTWQAQSLERVMEDVKDYTEMLGRCVGAVTKEGAETAGDLSRTVKRATATSKSEPV